MTENQARHREEPIRVVDGEEYWYCKLDLSIMMDSTITTHDAMVYAALCSFTSPTKANCYPSLQAIAARAKCSARQVTRCLSVLEEKGYIKVFRRKDERKSSIYYLARKREKAQVPNPQEPAFETEESTMDCESTIDSESIDCESIGQTVYPARTHSLVTIDSQSDELESRNIK
ncbi:MAG TPA: helix-turn-helix domain-containing protein, partial [Synergistaceae bacterium]|nr:helix-turn-helix domain-containing protein [Synergistaceae bacterium]